jgi:hypothetical protein
VQCAGPVIAKLGGKASKVLAHNAYASFVHHLYEFYVGIIKKNRCDLGNVPPEDMDAILLSEVEKLLRNRRRAIEQGYAPTWENHISVYQVEVPMEFGGHFRSVRNRTAHADVRRASPRAVDISLAEFYTRYHLFIYLLYQSAQFTWTIDDFEKHDWQSIEDFDLAIKRKPPEAPLGQ